MSSDCYGKKRTKEIEEAIEFLKMISERNRLKILCLLEKEEKCVCQIWQCLKLPQNLVSHHLKVLKNFVLISSRKEGVKVFYRLNKRKTSRYFKMLVKFIEYEKQSRKKSKK